MNKMSQSDIDDMVYQAKKELSLEHIKEAVEQCTYGGSKGKSRRFTCQTMEKGGVDIAYRALP